MEVYAEPLESYEAQAESGSVDAQLALGLKYSTGKGAPIDRISAHMWLNIAAYRGNEEAKKLRAELSREMSHNEVADAQKRARRWLAAHT